MTNILEEKSSFSGRILFKMDRFSHNIKLFIKRHDNSTEIIFIIIYLTIQLTLIFLVKRILIAAIILFLTFIMSIERIVLKFRSRQAEIRSSNLEKNYFRLKELILYRNIKSKK